MLGLKRSLALLVAVIVASVQAQTPDVTSLYGTWSSGSQAVTTGLDFYNPVTRQFTKPKNSGISYSFTEDGHFEVAKFIYSSNSKTNRCFKASLIWQHGTYQVHSNGSITMLPYGPDGSMEVLDPCAAETIQRYPFAEFELIPQYYMYIDNHPGFMPVGKTAYALELFQYDGQKMPIMWLKSRPPSMLPTSQLYQQVLNS